MALRKAMILVGALLLVSTFQKRINRVRKRMMPMTPLTDIEGKSNLVVKNAHTRAARKDLDLTLAGSVDTPQRKDDKLAKKPCAEEMEKTMEKTMEKLDDLAVEKTIEQLPGQDLEEVADAAGPEAAHTPHSPHSPHSFDTPDAPHTPQTPQAPRAPHRPYRQADRQTDRPTMVTQASAKKLVAIGEDAQNYKTPAPRKAGGSADHSKRAVKKMASIGAATPEADEQERSPAGTEAAGSESREQQKDPPTTRQRAKKSAAKGKADSDAMHTKDNATPKFGKREKASAKTPAEKKMLLAEAGQSPVTAAPTPSPQRKAAAHETGTPPYETAKKRAQRKAAELAKAAEQDKKVGEQDADASKEQQQEMQKKNEPLTE